MSYCSSEVIQEYLQISEPRLSHRKQKLYTEQRARFVVLSKGFKLQLQAINFQEFLEREVFFPCQATATKISLRWHIFPALLSRINIFECNQSVGLKKWVYIHLTTRVDRFAWLVAFVRCQMEPRRLFGGSLRLFLTNMIARKKKSFPQSEKRPLPHEQQEQGKAHCTRYENTWQF